MKRVTGDAAGSPAGEVSNHLHDHVQGGEVLRVSAPFGDVVLDEGDRPLLFASAGIGCTPMIGMLSRLAADGSARRVVSVHADRSPYTHAFRAELRQLTEKLDNATAEVWYERPEDGGDREGTGEAITFHEGLIDLSRVEVPAGTIAYLCGPVPFMKAARAQLLEAGVAGGGHPLECWAGPGPVRTACARPAGRAHRPAPGRLRVYPSVTYRWVTSGKHGTLLSSHFSPPPEAPGAVDARPHVPRCAPPSAPSPRPGARHLHPRGRPRGELRGVRTRKRRAERRHGTTGRGGAVPRRVSSSTSRATAASP
ncbi:Flavohemoprotein [Streptomyces rimosus subsp. rimosus]